MRFGSVCSGIEAASVAWEPLGWTAAWFSEIEPFPCAVLKHHYPDVPNLGDMTKLPAMIRSGQVEVPDLLCGGTPCQAFSVAGLRQSLADERGNLSLTFCEIADAIDEQRKSIIFWENVPGVLSTKDNAFGCFLGALAGEDDALIAPGGRWANAGFVDGPKRAVAWRILDAQYFGVAQRRRRVFVVASARNDFDPAAVLFEFEGVRRDSAPSREAGEKPAPCVTNGPPFSRTGNERVECEAIITMAHGQGGAEIATDRAPTLTCNHEAPIAFHPTQDPISSADVCHSIGANDNATAAVAFQQTADCLTAAYGTKWNGNASATNGSLFAAQPMPINTMEVAGALAAEPGAKQQTYLAQAIAWDEELNASVEQAGTLLRGGAGGRHDGVMQPINIYGGNKRKDRPEGGFYVRADEDTSKTLDAATGLNPTCSQGGTAVMHAMQVRRLTPVECERLQGFPDNYTNIKDKCPDGPRYKALGNSWAVPVVRWIGERIGRALG